MRTIKLGTISKKENSTAQPDTTGWAEYEVVFKNGVDLESPTITLQASLEDILPYNYAYLLGRYYWIRQRNVYRNDYCILSLDIDPLATYKTEIGATPLYILRSSAAKDGRIRDNFYPVTTEKSVTNIVMDDYPAPGFSGGVYVIAVAGTTAGGSTLYQLSPAQFTSLVNGLMATIDGTTAPDVIQAVKNSMFEPMRYINSVMWFPQAFGTSGSAEVFVGKWATGISAGIITNTIANLYTKSLTLPKHPQAAARGAYMNCAPFSQYVLEFAPFGAITLDSSQLAECTGIEIQIYVDALTGQGNMIVRGTFANGVTSCLADVSSQIGVPVKITSESAGSSALTGFSAVNSAIIGAALANPVAIAGAAVAGIASVADAITGAVSNVGSLGSIAANSMLKVFSATFYLAADDDNARNGRPYCKIATPASLGGFMIASKGEVSISGTITEEERITRYLENGFYYE